MPSVKMPKKSTATDMTPFVDVAFLILTFFILATKFKPPEPVTITTPHSVSASKLKEMDGVMISFDSAGRVFFTMQTQKKEDESLKYDLIKQVDANRKLGLTETEMRNFQKSSMVGSPFNLLKNELSSTKRGENEKGIPVDSTDNQLTTWIGAAKVVFTGKKADFMIKGDNNAKFPSFKGVIDALRANDIFKYKLVTDPRGVPEGSELYKMRAAGKGQETD
ncbi:MAG: ExbD/TolR family protein [Candidatus Dadabacteria bacterium]